MRRPIAAMLVILLAFALAGCAKNGEPKEKMPTFSCPDMDGNTVTNAVFSEYGYTLINLWGTWCAPCVRQLPTLQELYLKYEPLGINFIGVCEEEPGNEAEVIKVLGDKGVTYMNIYPDDAFNQSFVSNYDSSPTVVIVDNNGNIIKGPIVGARDASYYESVLDGLLKA